MSNKLLKIMLAILGVILLLLLFYVLIFMNFSGDNKAGLPDISKYIPGGNYVNQNQDTPGTSQTTVTQNNSTSQVRENSTNTNLKRTASAFAERFGSFSNQSNFRNISNLRIFMTDDMQEWAETYVEEVKKTNQDTSEYYGITTKSIQSEIVLIDEIAGKATIKVKTKRREAYKEMDNITSSFYQEIIIEFNKVAGVWKVDSANWQE